MIRVQFKKEMVTPGGRELLDIDLTIEQGEFAALFGQSGAGKTTFLKILAGLIMPQEGHISVDGEIWFDSARKINLPPQQRRAGFIFQENSLFPNMTVQGNLEYACREPQAHQKIASWVAATGLKGLEARKPHQLSGGQKQRVALARALLNAPKILLLDEPLSDLDIPSRLNLQDEILKTYRQTKITTILVSHDLAEVFKLSKKVFVIESGHIIKSGCPAHVFMNNGVSGKFKFTGEIMAIHQDGVCSILTVLVGNQLTRVVASHDEIKGLSVGSRVIMAAKAFNPLILVPQH